VTVLPGLADPVHDSQRVFRAVLEAMARPGRIVDVPGPFEVPRPLDPAAAAVCLTLVDFETPLWLDPAGATAGVIAFLTFHCGCPIVAAPGAATFAIVAEAGAMPPLAALEQGTAEHPDRSATLVVQAWALNAGRGMRLRGPGIARESRLEVGGLPDAFWKDWRDNHARFPRGVDVILSAGTVIAALPRTVQVDP
jgi:alpha-D-ribose 1-methylphosphonate 5-triphosphate synthase subunit PhnH